MKLISEGHIKNIPITLFSYNTFLKRFKGLMFRLKPIKNEGIIITPCNSIHMFFMFFSIDVVFLNKENEIIYLQEHVKPWTVIFPIKDAISVIELPAGTISKYYLEPGNTIKF